MSLFLSLAPLKLKKATIISGTEAFHMLQVRRVKAGENLKVQDEQGNRFLCTVESFTRNTVTVLPIKKLPVPRAAKTPITLYQAYISEQPLDFVLQKATELNVSQIVIFQAEHSPSTPKDINKKLIRWNKIALEATKQCERMSPPNIDFTYNLAESLKIHTPKKLVILDQDGTRLTFKKSIPSVGIIVGPEGGLTQAELESVTSYHPQRISLGPLILRSETAALAGIATINTYFN